MSNNYVSEGQPQPVYDATDPHSVIRAGKIPAKQAPPPVDDSAGLGEAPAAKVSDREDEEA